jgi:hypothetical protein
MNLHLLRMGLNNSDGAFYYSNLILPTLRLKKQVSSSANVLILTLLQDE